MIQSDLQSDSGGRGPQHDRALRAWLDGLRRRWRLLTGLGVAARAGAAVGVLLLGAWAANRLAAPVGVALVLLFAAAAALVIGVVTLLSRPLWKPPSDRQLARLAEERDPSLDEVLVTATERIEAGQPGPFDGLLVKSASERVGEMKPSRIIDRQTVKRAAILAGAAAILVVASAGVVRQPAWRAFQTARMLILPQRLTLVVEPGDTRVVAGSPLRITARVEGMPAGASIALPTIHVSGLPAGHGPISMRQVADRYVAEIDRVDRSLRYRVSSGSLTSREFQVAALEPAHVKRIDIEYEFPSFTKLPPRRVEDGGDIYGPAGTQVRLRVRTDKPVVSGAMTLREGDPIALSPATSDTELAGTFTLAKDGAYRLALRDLDGLASRGDTEYFIRVMDDRPPDVRIMRPGGDRQVTRLEEIVVEARADDDHGVSSLDLVYAVRGGKERVVPLHRAAPAQRAPEPGLSGSTSVTGAHTLYIEEMDVQPGDFVTYFARARDVSRGKRSTEARSDIFFLEVRPFNEEFFASQSQAMMGGGGSQAADLLEAQKEIIVATWKLQRRALAGQSAQDVKSVGKAQGELRSRAMALSSQMARPTPRRRGSTTGAQTTQAEENPLQKAVAAMGRAESSLNELKPADAVPHEMAAYNELLRLQAEITRRQVQRQRGGAGSGGRTGNQDLSALFDEELMRQQDTNYENKSQSASNDAQSQQDSALDKLKELARRQDEIAQRQRELARARVTLPQEELKRQLERLTREQEDLRRETQALSQQMASRQSASPQSGAQQQPGQQSASQSGGQQASNNSASGGRQGQSSSGERAQNREGAERLREAAQEMGEAARELSQANLDDARSRTDETAARLRELERRLAGDPVPDEGRRAFGEMQLEAQQVAEAQRRIASESRRAGRDAANNGGDTTRDGKGSRSGQQDTSQGRQNGAQTEAQRDAMRRLAAEQERLADRVAALERRLRSVSKSAGGDEAARAAAAARDELARQRLNEEMRRAASAMREGAAGARPTTSAPKPGASDPDARDRLVDTVDRLAQGAGRVAERLGSSVAGSPEARQLAEQLARLRGLRERMDDIEQRLREAVQRNGADPSRAQGARPGAPNARPEQPQSANSGQNGPRGSQPSPGQSGGQQAGSQQGAAQQGGAGGGGGAAGEIARLQEEYNNALRETRGLMDSLGRQQGGSQNGAMGTPEQHEFSRSAPGTEAFKQDYSRWDSLTKDVNLALEQIEASLARQLSERAAKDRVHSGNDDRAPAQYTESVSRYYRSLAKKPPQQP
jgi:hypothetical protein